MGGWGEGQERGPSRSGGSKRKPDDYCLGTIKITDDKAALDTMKVTDDEAVVSLGKGGKAKEKISRV